MGSRKPIYAMLAAGVAVVLTLSFVPYSLTRLSEAGQRVVAVVTRTAPVDVPPARPLAVAPEFDAASWYMEREEEPEKHGVLIETFDGQRVLASHNADTSFNPASLVKLATTLAALRRLGANFRFETRVYTEGAVDNSGVLRGKIYVSTNDPVFGDVAAAAIARELRARGINDSTEGVAVAPGFCFNLSNSPEESAERLLKALDFKKGDAARQKKAKEAEKEKKESGKKETDKGGEKKQAARDRRRDASRPSEKDKQATQGREAARGENANANAGEAKTQQENAFVAEPPPGEPLFRVQSYTLREVLLYMNVHSSNFVAERVGNLVGGPEAVRQLLIDELKLPPDQVVLGTTSGLEVNRMTPRGLVAVIRALHEEVGRQGLKLEDIMPIASDEGTLRRRLTGTPLESAAVGKTGTLVHDDGGMASLAGVVYTQSSGMIVFAMLAQGSQVWQSRQLEDQLLTEIITARDAPSPLPSDTPRKIFQHDNVTVTQGP